MKDLKLYSGNACLSPNNATITTDEKDIVSQAYIMLFYNEPPGTFDKIHFKIVDTLKANYNVSKVEVTTISSSKFNVLITLNSGETIQLGL